MKYTPEETDFYPSSMSFASGFLGPRGDVGYFMVADFEKAKDIIQSLISEGRKVTSAEMGLDGDWNVNSETIYEDGSFATEYTAYSHSQWAPTVLIVNFEHGENEMYPVWKREEKNKA